MSRNPNSPIFNHFATLRYENNENRAYYAVVTDPKENWFGQVIVAKEVSWYGADNCPKKPQITFDVKLDDEVFERTAVGVSQVFSCGNLDEKKIKFFHTKGEALELAKKLSRLIPTK